MGKPSLYPLGNYVLPPGSINTKLTIIKKMAVAYFTRMYSGPKSLKKANEHLLKNGQN